jgi:hypothetical protein
VKASWEWKQPSLQKGVKAFLGLANYYGKFICNFSKIAKPLSNLLKKGISPVWEEYSYQGFEELINKLFSPPVLKSQSLTSPLWCTLMLVNLPLKE